LKTSERPKLIKNEHEYSETLKRIEQIQDAEPGTREGDELELLALLVENYEEEQYNIKDADSVDVIEYYLEKNGLKQKDLVGIIGDKAPATAWAGTGKKNLWLKKSNDIFKNNHLPRQGQH